MSDRKVREPGPDGEFHHVADLDQTIKNWDGTTFEMTTEMCQACGRSRVSEPLTLKRVLLSALSGQHQDDRGMSPSKMYARMDLGMRVQRRDKIEFTVDEISMLKELISKMFVSPLIVTQSHRMVDHTLKVPDHDM